MNGGVQPDEQPSARWLDAVVEAVPFGVAVLDGDLRILEATPRFWALVGRAPTELRATLPELIGHADEEVVRATRRLHRTGESFDDVEFLLEGADGARVIHASGYALDDDDPAPDASGRRMALTLVEVTHRRRHGERLASSFLRLSSAFAAAYSPHAVGELVVHAGIDAVGAVSGTLYLLDPTRTRLIPTGVQEDATDPFPRRELLVTAELPVCAAVRDGKVVWVHDLDDMRVRFPAYLALSPTGMAEGGHVAVPVFDGDRVKGAIVFTWMSPRRLEDADRMFLDAIAAECGQALRRAELFADERAAREHVERVADHVLRLERITGVLGSASAPTEVIDRFLDECLPLIGAQYGAVFDFDPATRTMSAVGSRTTEAWDGRPVSAEGSSMLAEAVRTRQPVLLENLDAIRDFVPESLEPPTTEQAWTAVPLVAYGDVLGVVGLRYEGERHFDTDDRLFLERVGRRLAEALDRSRLYAQQRDAREQAEAAARWLRSVQSMAAALARSATRRDVARSLREHLHPATRADYSIVAALTGEGGTLDVLTATSTSTMASRELDTSLQVGVRESLLRGRSIELVGAEHVASMFSGLARAGIGSFVLLPIRSGRNLIAALGVGWTSAEPISPEARRLLSIAVSLGGAAFERAAAYDLDHHIAETLQRHLLTEPDTEVPGVAWAARYAPGAVELTAGGDWYDVIALPDGRVALVVGDIVGHGINAAAAMGQIRSATRALALREDAVGVLEALDTFASDTGQGNLSSLAYVVLDPALATLEFAIAGHPPPLLRDPSGATEFVHEARGPLIGIAEPGTRRSYRHSFATGSSIVLFTDGLVERRGEPIDAGFNRLDEALRETPLSLHPEGLCDHLLSRLAVVGTAPDDITLLSVCFDRFTTVFERTYPARPELLRVMRTDVRAWLTENAIEGEAAADVLLAAGEATANAIDHGAGRNEAQTIALRLAIAAGPAGEDRHAVVTVQDSGTWPEALRVAQRGHGLDIMQTIMASVDIRSDERGTTVTMRRALDGS